MTVNAKKLISYFTDLIFPPLCPLCKVPESATEANLIAKDGLCHECRKAITPLPSPICAKCGTPFSGTIGIKHCGACLKDCPPFTLARSAFTYDGPLLSAIHHFKYNKRTSLAPTLGRLAGKALNEINLDYDKIVPIPLHKNRLKRRGFNQSLLLAREILRQEQRDPEKPELDYQNLIRQKDTRSQIELKGKAREINVKGAFSVIDKTAFKDKKILLIDDVYTTGATIKECSRILSACGAEVFALTLARVIRV